MEHAHLFAVHGLDLGVLPGRRALGNLQPHPPDVHAVLQVLLDHLQHCRLLGARCGDPRLVWLQQSLAPDWPQAHWGANTCAMHHTDQLLARQRMACTAAAPMCRGTAQAMARVRHLPAQEVAALLPALADGPFEPCLHRADVLVEVVACSHRTLLHTPRDNSRTRCMQDRQLKSAACHTQASYKVQSIASTQDCQHQQ